jgi:hypothetical protein
MERVRKQNPDLGERVAGWRSTHPSGTLEEAVRDLKLWERPGDKDAQWLVWCELRALKDPAAMQGIQAMRRAAVTRNTDDGLNRDKTP